MILRRIIYSLYLKLFLFFVSGKSNKMLEEILLIVSIFAYENIDASR